MATEAIPQDKKWLVRALKFIDLPTSGNDEQDIHSLADAIAKYVDAPALQNHQLTEIPQAGRRPWT
jgi:hypothetical protein